MATSSSAQTVRHTIPQEDEHQPETDSPYYQTLLRCTPKLVTALSGSPLSVADELLGKALISSEVYRSLLVSSLTPDNKAREMVVSVSSAVQLNSSKYVEFIQILQNDISLLSTGIIKTLHDTYSAIKAELQAQEQLQTSTSHQEESSISPAVDDLSAASSSHLAPINAGLSQDIEVAQKAKKSLTGKFNQIVLSMKDLLKESSETVHVDQFRDVFLLSLDVFEKDRHAHFFGSYANKLSEASTFDALFIIFGLYWDYLNYHLLECLVREYGDADTKRSMKEYVEDVSSFMEATTLQVFWKIEPCLKSVPPPGFKETVVRYDRGIFSATSTLTEVENIRLKINENTQIRKFAVLLSAITEGSILITWFTLFHCEYNINPFELQSQGIPGVSAVFNRDDIHSLVPRPIPSFSILHAETSHLVHTDRYQTAVVHYIDEYFGGDIIIPSMPPTPLSMSVALLEGSRVYRAAQRIRTIIPTVSPPTSEHAASKKK